MGLTNTEIAINNKKAYFFNQKKANENFNFHDYAVNNYSKHLVIEGGWDEKFISILSEDIEALSVVGFEDNIDVGFISDYLPNIKQLYISCKSVLNSESIFLLNKLEDISYTCQKNSVVKFELPNTIKSFVVDWKSKYILTNIPPSLEYLCIDGGKGLNWTSLIGQLKSLIKIDLISCDIDNGDVLFSLPKLRYLSLTNCKFIRVLNNTSSNDSIKYIYLTKVPVENIEWVSILNLLDIIILENCGTIKDILPLKNKRMLRGVSLSGNTTVLNGDLTVLETLTNLRNVFIAPANHYTHKSIYPWNWKNFNNEIRRVIERK